MPHSGHALMEALSLPEYSVLGWCDGGTAGLILAATFPNAVKKLVVFGSRSYVTEGEAAFYESTRVTTQWEPGLRDVWTEMYGASAFQKMWSAWLDSFNRCLSNKKGDICIEELSKIVCPTLIVHGAKDGMCPLLHGEFLRDHVTGSRLVVMEEARHMLHFKFTQEFNKLVQEFLSTGS